MKCPVCHGFGKGQPFSTGHESSWRINQWLMEQPCGRCGGTGKVKKDTKPKPRKRKERAK